jgi:hypothetical protein
MYLICCSLENSMMICSWVIPRQWAISYTCLVDKKQLAMRRVRRHEGIADGLSGDDLGDDVGGVQCLKWMGFYACSERQG